MKMRKPKTADYFGWEKFVEFFNLTFPNTEFEAKNEEEYWAFWKAGYINAVNI